MQRYCLLLYLFFAYTQLKSQQGPVFANLPVGKYAVGFKVITLTDSSRISKPEYNYLGEKNTEDRFRRITIHLWYPAKESSVKRRLTYSDYCFNSLLTGTNDSISNVEKNAQINGRRGSVEAWFGKTTDDAWEKLAGAPMLALANAETINEKFPLLIGMLRPLSTSITNEMLTSQGYVVAMIQQDNFSSFALSTLEAIPDMRLTISFLEKNANIDNDRIGTFGFSGSGFSQVLFAMNDYRIKAVADLESGIYMDGLYQSFSSSNYYLPSKLRVPFLHIFSRDLSKQEKFIDDFENKTRFAKRYRLLLNQPALHHWDFAAEGYTATIFLNNRGDQSQNIRQSFEIASYYLLNFFNAELKADAQAVTFLSAKPSLKQQPASLWDIALYDRVKPPPDKDEFEYIIRKKGIKEALSIVNNTLKNDSSTNLVQGFVLNNLGYSFINEMKYEEAIGIFKLNTEIHPNEANFFDSLAEGYELSGDKADMKRVSGIVIDLLNKKNILTGAEKSLKEVAERRLK